MVEHRKTFVNIQLDFFDICVKSVEYPYNYYNEMIEDCLSKHFHMNECCLFTFENDFLKPFDVDSTLEVECSGVPWRELEGFFNNQQKLIEVPSFVREKKEFNELSHMLLLEREQGEKEGILIFKETKEWSLFSKSTYFEQFVHIFSNVIHMLNKYVEIRLNENQYRKLYNMADLFHSTMDIDVILKNVLQTIQENYPLLNADLILSNDQDRQTTIHIKPFDYLAERPSVIESFVSGTLTTEQLEDKKSFLLNAPIKGRQAIYGVLQVSGPMQCTMSPMQINFIEKLAHASGNALENAKLYHQSHRLVSDLQLINETIHHLNRQLNIDEMVTFLQKQLMKSIKPMEIGFFFKEKGEYKLSDVTTDIFKTDDRCIYINHVVNHFEKSQDPLFIADFCKLISKDIRFSSMMAIPMIVEQRIYGFCIVLHEESYYFSFDSFKLMQSLIQHSSLAIANSVLRNQLQVMVDHDHLTKLHARRFLDRFVKRSLKNDRCGMFLLIDIDNFKRVNDTYGHQVGDKVLVQIADQLRNIVGTRGICARWGGEEMSVYVPNMHVDEPIALTNEIVTSIPQVTNPQVTVSAGLVTWSSNSGRPEYQSIFLQADTALYHAKNNGKNRVCIFDESMSLQP